MMKRRGGSSGGPQSSTLSGTNSTYNRQYDSNEKQRTILITSAIWVLILSLSLFIAIRFYSSPNCSQTSIIKSKNFIFNRINNEKQNILFFRCFLWYWTSFNSILFRFL